MSGQDNISKLSGRDVRLGRGNLSPPPGLR